MRKVRAVKKLGKRMRGGIVFTPQNYESKSNVDYKKDFERVELDFARHHPDIDYDEELYMSRLEKYLSYFPPVAWRHDRLQIADLYDAIREKISRAIERQDVIKNEAAKKPINFPLPTAAVPLSTVKANATRLGTAVDGYMGTKKVDLITNPALKTTFDGFAKRFVDLDPTGWAPTENSYIGYHKTKDLLKKVGYNIP